jgi:cell division protein FtsZ
MIRFAQEPLHRARITVVGVGGAGGNAVNRMVAAQLPGVDFVAANTDAQALAFCQAREGIQLGAALTRGLGSGGDPAVGRRAAEEDGDAVRECLAGSDMVFITAGMGGGTGTGASPVVARAAKEMGALTVGVVTRPFDFEGPVRRRQAEEGLRELKGEVDTLIVIPNQRLLSLVDPDTPLDQAFLVADEVLLKATRGICELITRPGLINLDFADVRTVMAEMGDALMGSGAAEGDSRAVEAAQQAVSCPLLEDVSIAGAQGLLVNVTGGKAMSLHEVSSAVSVVNEAAGGGANLIFGAVLDEAAAGELRVTVIATGIGEAKAGVAEESLPDASTVDIRRFRSEDLLRPAFRRREEEVLEPVTVPKGQVRVLADEDLETPAFLRRKID